MKCSRCKQERKDELPGKRCPSCVAYWKQYYRENRASCIARAVKSLKRKGTESRKIYRKEARRRLPVSAILASVKRNVHKKKIPFNLTKEDIIIPERCPVLGIILQMGDGHACPNSPSIDRTVPSLGYVKGNISVMSHRANTIKSNATADDIRKLIAYLENLQE